MTLPRIIAFLVLAHIAFISTRMNGSLYALANNTSTFTVGVLMALFALVPMLIAVRAGRWLDAVGPRRPLATGFLMIFGGTLLPAAFPYPVADIAPLLIAASLVGTGMMLVQLTTQNLVGQRADPANLPAAFSWLALGASLSGLTSPVVTGVLIDSIGHRLTFAAFTLVTVVALAFLMYQWQHLPTRRAAPSTAEPPSMFDLLRYREIRNILLLNALLSSAWDLQTFMIPVHGTRVGLSASGIGLVLGSFAVATFAIRLAMPRLSRSFREWEVLTFTLFTAAIAFALMPWFGTLWPLAGCAFLLGLGLGAAQPNVMSLLHSRSPEGRIGEALGLRTTVMNSSHVVLPLIFGALGSVVGAGAAFGVMAGLLGAGGVTALKGQHKR
jgi:predicted MFS family arabinose efflux permease